MEIIKHHIPSALGNDLTHNVAAAGETSSLAFARAEISAPGDTKLLPRYIAASMTAVKLAAVAPKKLSSVQPGGFASIRIDENHVARSAMSSSESAFATRLMTSWRRSPLR